MHNADLCTVEVHVSRVSDTPPPRCPGLTVDVAVLAVEPALVTGLRAVDQHVAGVPPALVLPGPVITGLVSVSTARLRFHCRFHCGLDGAASDLGIAGTRVESVDLPDVRVREYLTPSYLTARVVLLFDRLQPPGLNTTVELFTPGHLGSHEVSGVERFSWKVVFTADSFTKFYNKTNRHN